MAEAWFSLKNEAEIPSPALVIYRERVEENLRRMVRIAGGPERLCPHVKTHKLAPLVQAQLALGIRRFKCATIAEAEMAAEAGAAEVMLAFPSVGPNLARLVALQQRFSACRFSAIADSEEGLRALQAAAEKGGIVFETLLDLDCGMRRTGIPPGEEAVSLYQLLTQLPALRAGGLHVYDGHIVESDLTARTAQCDSAFGPVLALQGRLKRLGLPVPRLVAGGSPTFAIHARHPDRELSPGTSVLWDFGYGDRFAELPFEPAALLLTRVVSKPGAQRLCLDLGHKAVAAEQPMPRVRLLELPEAAAIMHSEEHLVIETPQAGRYQVGDVLHGIPKHICPTVALHAEAWVAEAGAARERWPIAARARRITF